MLARHLLLATLASVSLVSGQAQPTQGASLPRHLVVVRTSGPAQLLRLLALDLDLASCRAPLIAQRRVELIVDDSELDLLKREGFAVRVLRRDLERWYAAQARAAAPAGGFPDDPTPPLGQGAMGGHWTFAQMEAIFDQLHARNPSICAAKVSVGTSIEGRPLWMVKISDNVGVDENEPEVLFDALHHAREPLSMETTVVFMDWLVTNYGTDPDATLIVDERELFFVPCVNPDGYVYNETTNPGGGGLWRKNRRVNADNTIGVDLNRNYATQWIAPNGGSSSTTNSQTYRGTAPFSEPETAAMEAFAASRNFVTVFSTHTYSDILLRPWCWEVNDPANVADYQTLGAYYTVENGMPHGRWSTLLYISGGTSVDHHHVARGSYSWGAAARAGSGPSASASSTYPPATSRCSARWHCLPARPSRWTRWRSPRVPAATATSASRPARLARSSSRSRTSGSPRRARSLRSRRSPPAWRWATRRARSAAFRHSAVRATPATRSRSRRPRASQRPPSNCWSC